MRHPAESMRRALCCHSLFCPVCAFVCSAVRIHRNRPSALALRPHPLHVVAVGVANTARGSCSRNNQCVHHRRTETACSETRSTHAHGSDGRSNRRATRSDGDCSRSRSCALVLSTAAPATTIATTHAATATATNKARATVVERCGRTAGRSAGRRGSGRSRVECGNGSSSHCAHSRGDDERQ